MGSAPEPATVGSMSAATPSSVSAPAGLPVRLKPALRLVWRGPTTVQIGLDPRRGVVLDGLTATRPRPRSSGSPPTPPPSPARTGERDARRAAGRGRPAHPPTHRPSSAGRSRSGPGAVLPGRRSAWSLARRRHRRLGRLAAPAPARGRRLHDRLARHRREPGRRGPHGLPRARVRRRSRDVGAAPSAAHAQTSPAPEPVRTVHADLVVLIEPDAADAAAPPACCRARRGAPVGGGARGRRRRRTAGRARAGGLPALPRPAPSRPRPGVAAGARPAGSPGAEPAQRRRRRRRRWPSSPVRWRVAGAGTSRRPRRVRATRAAAASRRPARRPSRCGCPTAWSPGGRGRHTPECGCRWPPRAPERDGRVTMGR